MSLMNIEYYLYNDIYYVDVEERTLEEKEVIADFVATLTCADNKNKNFEIERRKIKNSILCSFYIDNVVPFGKIYKN